MTHQQQTVFGNIVGKVEIAHNEQCLLFPQCFRLNQIIVSPYVHIFYIMSLFAAELEKPKIGISGKVLKPMIHLVVKPCPKRQILDSSKLKQFADDNIKFDEIGRKLSKQVKNTVGKGEIARYEQFLLFSQFFKRLVGLLQTSEKKGLFGKGLNQKVE